MIYITGDTHADFTRFYEDDFPQQRSMTKDDYVIICGDFGGVWNNSARQALALDALDDLPFTTLFLDGNHENYDLLAAYPVSVWHGGKVQFIRDSVIHLMRGQVYEIDGKTFFTMGGAACHDIQNGVIEEGDADFEEKMWEMRQRKRFYRINHLSWWAQELPTKEELREGWANLEAHGKKVDYVLTHCAPTKLQRTIQLTAGDSTHPENELTAFLQRVYRECSFTRWYCGHYHVNLRINAKFFTIYEVLLDITAPDKAQEASSENKKKLTDIIKALFKTPAPDAK